MRELCQKTEENVSDIPKQIIVGDFMRLSSRKISYRSRC